MPRTDGITWYVIADGTRARVVRLGNGPARSVPLSTHAILSAVDTELVGRNLKSREVLADRFGQRGPG